MWKNLFKFGNKGDKTDIKDEEKTEQELQHDESFPNEELSDNKKEKSEEIVEKEYLEVIDEKSQETQTEIVENENILGPVTESEKEEVQIQQAETVQVTEASEIQKSENDNQENFEEKPTKKGFFSRLKEGLTKTRDNINKQIDNVFKAFVKIDEELFEELEEILIMSDVGVDTSVKIIENLRTKAKERKLTESIELKELLKEEISDILRKEDKEIIPNNGKPTIILVMGVNGVGKTTTIGKMGYRFSKEGKKVLYAAADTFRAAAIDQLEVWSKRSGVDIIKHSEGSDPAAVIFDAIKAAKARKTDILICDTAGRLHNKKNLMEELKKISRIIDREYPEANKETFLVLDSTTGQNALNQAKIFSEVSQITGIILTKLDGTAKGGIIIAIKDQMDIPVKFIGVGEKMYDLQEFNPQDFAAALFEE